MTTTFHHRGRALAIGSAGATSGLGRAGAVQMARDGATVRVLERSRDKTERVVAENRTETGNPGVRSDDLRTSRRVLVSGASGYVGGRLVPELLGGGHTVRCVVRDPRIHRLVFPGSSTASPTTRPETTVNEPSPATEPDSVIHHRDFPTDLVPASPNEE